ncbi:MAG: glycerol-3-phosphate dehydrogenase/oxidase [Opitutus sp.]|nr:glycerol-3-phosphate dehydrogenase/oxidase [Opitutus sp.]
MNISIDRSRSAALAKLASAEFDVLVVGGGIVGSGVARDAAMRGLRVALLDRHDFAFGTSSRSSRLLHGGLRYLEQGHIGLVREASVEKKTLQDIAPHLARPLGFVFPAYRGQGRPLWQLRIGVKLYDLLCRGGNFLPSRALSPAETLAAAPGLDATKLSGAVRYADALTNDGRLVLDTLRSAERHGGVLANYVCFLGAQRDGVAWRCTAEDTRTGRSLSLRALTVVNATGPWAQQIPHSSVRLRLSKGIHIVVARERLPVKDAIVLGEGRRILFVLPWGERVILGTTDTDYDAAPENVTVDASDIRYVLRVVNEAFPQLRLDCSDIISSWAGLRPLVAQADGTPSDISRAHDIRESRPGWWDVTGGKLTTYRLMAEETVDELQRRLGLRARCRTATESLLDEPPLYSGIEPPALTREAVAHYVHHEWAKTLEDIMVRRSGWHYLQRDSANTAQIVACWMADLLSWSPEEQQHQIESYRNSTRVAA